jgi:hypothetical protein
MLFYYCRNHRLMHSYKNNGFSELQIAAYQAYKFRIFY